MGAKKPKAQEVEEVGKPVEAAGALPALGGLPAIGGGRKFGGLGGVHGRAGAFDVDEKFLRQANAELYKLKSKEGGP